MEIPLKQENQFLFTQFYQITCKNELVGLLFYWTNENQHLMEFLNQTELVNRYQLYKLTFIHYLKCIDSH